MHYKTITKYLGIQLRHRRTWLGLASCLFLLLVINDTWVGASGPVYVDINDVPPAEVAVVLGTAATVQGRTNLFFIPHG